MTGHSPESLAAIQGRTLRTLLASQVCGGVGLVSSISVTVLLAHDLTGNTTVAGMTAASLSVGAAIAAIALARIMANSGRRRGLVTGYLVGAMGTSLAAVAALTGAFVLLPIGVLLAGAASAANLATRYAAADLAPEDRRASTIGVIFWASTIGSGFGSLVSLSLIDPGGQRIGLTEYAAPYCAGALLLTAAAVIIAIRLRPDPLVLAGGVRTDSQPRLPFTHSMRLILEQPRARTAVLAMGISQAVMVGIMTLTPLHMKDGGQSGAAISIMLFSHIMGMYLFSPFVGMLTDRVGRYPMLLGAAVLCVAGAAMAGSTSPEGFAGLTVGLTTIGLAWSFGVIAASGLLTESFAVEHRASVQGAGDLCMAGLGALAGLGAGGIVSLRSYLDLNLIAIGLAVLLFAAVAYTAATDRMRRAVADAPAG